MYSTREIQLLRGCLVLAVGEASPVAWDIGVKSFFQTASATTDGRDFCDMIYSQSGLLVVGANDVRP